MRRFEIDSGASAAEAPADPGPIAWTPEWRVLAPALRGFSDPPPPPDDLRAIWDRLRQTRLGAGIRPDHRNLLTQIGVPEPEPLLESPDPPPPGPPAADAFIHFLLPFAGVIEFQVLRGGLEYALESLFEWADRRDIFWHAWAADDRTAAFGMWLALRWRVLAAAPADYAAVRAVAERLRRRARSRPAALVAVVFPDEPWAEEDLSAWMQLQPRPSLGWDLSVLLVDVSFGLARAFIAAAGQQLDERSWRGCGLAQGLMAKHGPAAAILLADLFDAQIFDLVLRREIIAGWAAVRTAESFRLLVERCHHRDIAAAARAALAGAPRLGLEAAARHVGRGSTEEAPKLILRSLAAAHPELAADLAARLPPAGAAALRSVLGQDAPISYAEPELWPEVLRSPPWERARRPASAAPGLRRELAPLPFEETMTWLAGERERWLAGSASGPDLRTLCGQSGFRLEWLPAAREGDPGTLDMIGRRRLPALLLLRLAKDDALDLWRLAPARCWSAGDPAFKPFLASTDLQAALPALLAAVELEAHFLPLLLPVDSPRVAPVVARLYRLLKKDRLLAARWPLRHPRAAACGLIPMALGEEAEARKDALTLLRYVSGQHGTDEILEVAEAYGTRPEFEKVLQASDKLERVPAKLPRLPAFWDAALLPAPRLRNGEALPPQAVDRLGTMLTFSSQDQPYEGIGQVRGACEPASLEAFAWGLFQSWLAFGAPAKEQWAMTALGQLGGNDCARRLEPLIRDWPGEGFHSRAVLGLDVLASIGSDAALIRLLGLAGKAKSKPVQEQAKAKFAWVAERRGLSAAELADGLTPD